MYAPNRGGEEGIVKFSIGLPVVIHMAAVLPWALGIGFAAQTELAVKLPDNSLTDQNIEKSPTNSSGTIETKGFAPDQARSRRPGTAPVR